MGRTLNALSERPAPSRTIFHHRFVIECCEAFHVHYRNLRIVLSERDFVSFAEGVQAALKRWRDRGSPETSKDIHIELCRKEVAVRPVDDNKFKVNLNDNLYSKNEGKIFSEGAGLEDERYIHFKLRDLRLEMTIDEFNEMAETVKQAQEKLCQLVS